MTQLIPEFPKSYSIKILLFTVFSFLEGIIFFIYTFLYTNSTTLSRGTLIQLIAIGIVAVLFLYISVKIFTHVQLIQKLQLFIAGFSRWIIAQLRTFLPGTITIIWLILLIIPVNRLDGIYRILWFSRGFLLYCMVIIFQWALLVFFWSKNPFTEISLSARKLLLQIVFLSFTFLSVLAGIIVSKFGLAPMPGYWYGPGTPLLSWQVFIAWNILWVAQYLSRVKVIQSKFLNFLMQKTWRVDFIIAIIIWLVTVVTWWNTPLQKNYFVTQPLPPNYENYPYSDAANYDINAIKVLSGQYMSASEVNKPLYTLLLVAFRLIAGGNYLLTIAIQVVLFACIPVLIYLIVKTLFNRPAAFAASFLVMVREVNAISIPDILTVSHVKLLMSDVPTMALILAFVYLMILWLQNSNRISIKPMISGLILGLLVLLRAQTLAFVPVVLFVYGILEIKHGIKQWLISTTLFILGLSLLLIPWGVRNSLIPNSTDDYFKNGYQRLIISDYGLLYDHEVAHLPDESETDYYDRAQIELIQVGKASPGRAMSGISAYFIHNIIDTMMYLPLHYRGSTITSYLDEMKYVNNWKMKLSPLSIIFLVINLILLSIGCVAVNRKSGRIFWMLLAIYAAYLLTNAIFLHSGLRIVLPVDWIPLLFYVIGISWIMNLLMHHDVEFFPGSLLQKDQKELPNGSLKNLLLRRVLPLSIFILLMGAGLPIYESIMVDKYQPEPVGDQIDRILSGDCGKTETEIINKAGINLFLQKDNATIITGASLYPRFYSAGEGYFGTIRKEFEIQDFPRLSFMLLSKNLDGVILRITTPPSSFPNNDSVTVLGCQRGGLIDAIIIETQDGKCYQREPEIKLSCIP